MMSMLHEAFHGLDFFQSVILVLILLNMVLWTIAVVGLFFAFTLGPVYAAVVSFCRTLQRYF